jgi:N-acyl amino acid synthase of PEP-CTERM/exosortase system
MQYGNIGEQFREQFQAVFANTAELKKEVYRIRYEVYCQELKYESPDKFPEHQEIDNYDDRSLHCLLKHRMSGQYAGCVRLVFPDPSQSDRSLPLNKICTLDLDLKELPTHSFGEVSRLAVIDRFRRRTGESQTPAGLLLFPNQTQEEREKRGFPVIALSLYLAATCLGIESGMERVLVLMEPRLARHLRYFGFTFTQIGDFVEFRGKRGPYQIISETIVNGLPPHIVELMEVIREDLKLSELNLKLDLNPKTVVI